MDESKLNELEKFAEWMDAKFLIPGTNIRFGLDSVIGLLPGVGDSVTFFSAFYLIAVANNFNVPWYIKLLMIWNAFIDWLFGLVPLIGDIFDIKYKSNQKNVALIKEHKSGKKKT